LMGASFNYRVLLGLLLSIYRKANFEKIYIPSIIAYYLFIIKY
jgi:hypothetical protein